MQGYSAVYEVLLHPTCRGIALCKVLLHPTCRGIALCTRFYYTLRAAAEKGPEGRPGMSDALTPVWNLRAVV